MTTTGRDLVNHWGWAADRGLMNSNTANAVRAACTKVLEIEKGWESVDVTALDIDALLKRFQTLKGKAYKPRSLKEYQRRFRQAHESYLAYLRDPRSWTSGVQERRTRNGKTIKQGQPTRPAVQQSAGQTASMRGVAGGFVEYPFPLREDRIARLSLPVDLKSAEVKRLAAFMAALAIDGDPSRRK